MRLAESAHREPLRVIRVGRRVADRVGLAPRRLDQVGERAQRAFRSDRHRDRRLGDLGDRREVGRLVGLRGVRMRRDGALVANQEGAAVFWRAGAGFGAAHAGTVADVLQLEVLLQSSAKGSPDAVENRSLFRGQDDLHGRKALV